RCRAPHPYLSPTGRVTPALSSLSLHDALPILAWRGSEMIGVSAQNTKIHVAIASWDWPSYFKPEERAKGIRMCWAKYKRMPLARSEEHTSELQSRSDLVCRLLLEKKKKRSTAC